MRKRDVVDPAPGDVRPDVHVQVVRSADEGAGALARANSWPVSVAMQGL